MEETKKEILRKLSERFKESVKDRMEEKGFKNSDLDEASWNYQEGVLISYREAELLSSIVDTYLDLLDPEAWRRELWKQNKL